MHLCTVEDQAHKNTITDICLSKRPKKIFTSSLDADVKCWNFSHEIQEDFYKNIKIEKYSYNFNEISTGRKRVKINSLAYFNQFDLLVSGGTDRFINIYDQANERYRCSTKIAKQGGNINQMCTIDTDKLIVG